MAEVRSYMNSDWISTRSDSQHEKYTTTSQPPNRNAVAIARSQMSPLEAEQWDLYMTKPLNLPDIDWNLHHEPPFTGKKGQLNAKRRIEALNRLYDVDCADASHVAWIQIHHEEWLPLVKAMARVIGAERQYGAGAEDVLTPLQKVQRLNKTISGLSQVQKGLMGSLCSRKKSVDQEIVSLIEMRRKIRHKRTLQQKRDLMVDEGRSLAESS